MKIALIVAMAENGVIGKNNQLPWYLPEDLKYFKATTMGKPIVMGRKTFESIGKALPGRTNIVLSRQTDLKLPEGVRIAASIEEAIDISEAVSVIDGSEEIMIIGGEQIYTLFMEKASRLYLTKVHAAVEGDAYFSGFEESEWELMTEEGHKASGSNPHDYSFCVLERKKVE